jgi:3',5'-cyclic AMP phosphodiesterase CpdA
MHRPILPRTGTHRAAGTLSLLLGLALMACAWGADKAAFSFDFMTDTHTSPVGGATESFAKTCEHIMKTGPGAFLVLGGDCDNFIRTRDIVEESLAKPLAKNRKAPAYPIYLAVGNHDVVSTSNVKEDDDGTGLQTMAIVAHGKALPAIVNRGPKDRSKLAGYGEDGSQYTTYSFDHGNAHFIILDLYSENAHPNRGNGVMSKSLLAWVKEDLRKTRQQHIFVVGHEPCLIFSSTINGTAREITPGELIEQGDREGFWTLLKEDPRVVAYFSGHSHVFGMKQDGTLWQIVGSKARDNWKTHMSIQVDGDSVACRTYREENGRWVEYNETLRK